jgi:BR serine/threonine kinase
LTPPGSPLSQPYWKSRLNTLKNSFLGSPRFHRRKLQVPLYDEVGLTPESSPELTKRSWFGSLMGTERDETHVILIKDRQLSSIKADLIHAFLSISDLSHSVLSPMSFRVEYKRPGGTAMFQRNVRLHVDITCATPPQESNTNGNIEKNGDKPTIYCITFTLISGPLRRFKRICDHIQGQILGRRSANQHSPRMGRRPTRELSDTSSCGSCGSDSLSPTPTRIHVSEDTVSLAAAVVNTSTTNLTGALSRCKSDQDATKDIFEREVKLLSERRQENPRIITNMTNGRRLSLEPKLQTDKV